MARLIAGQGTGVITNLNAGVLSQAEGLQILPEGVHAHSVSHLREEVVAGLGDGLRHIDETVVAAGAVGAAVGGVVGIDPPAGRVDLLGGSNDPLLQRGHGRQGLDGGAGDVRPVGGAVCEGAGRVIVESRVDHRWDKRPGPELPPCPPVPPPRRRPGSHPHPPRSSG